MPLVRIVELFDASGWLFEVKHAGFRALARVEGIAAGSCRGAGTSSSGSGDWQDARHSPDGDGW